MTITQQLLEDLSIPLVAGPEFRSQFAHYASLVDLPQGSTICWEGDACEQLSIVASGVVRVYKVGESGREITLYRLERGQSCILTASCILSHVRFPALAIAETDVQAIVVPSFVVRSWMQRFPEWQEYVFSLMAERVSDIIATVEEVAFRRMDTRIARYLLESTDGEEAVAITHQEIAYDLGTAREVVSRVLKEFERDGLVSLSRGEVAVLDRQRLISEFAGAPT
jgi:CRP/FNR family transcriptional regulator